MASRNIRTLIQIGIVVFILIMATYSVILAEFDFWKSIKILIVTIMILLLIISEILEGRKLKENFKEEWERGWYCLKCGQLHKFDYDMTINKSVKTDCKKCGAQHIVSLVRSIELYDPSKHSHF